MRLLLTLDDGADLRDVVVDAGDSPSVGELASALGWAGPLFCGDERLDPALPLADSVVRHGSVLRDGAPARDLGTAPGGVVEVRVTSGPGTGRVVRLNAGSYALDAVVPRAGGRLRVAPDGRVSLEPGATPLRLDGDDVSSSADWRHGRQLSVGEVLLEVHPVRAPDAPLTPGPGGATLDLTRPPRLRPQRRTTAFSLPPEPKRPDRPPFPLAMMLVPVLMGVVLYLVTRSAYSLIFLGMSPLMALASFSTGSRHQRRRWRGEVREYARRTAAVRDAARSALVEERTARRHGLPDAAALLVTAVGPRARLWERRRHDPDFLLVRVGTADQPSEVTLQDPARESHEGLLTWTAPDVPVCVHLTEAGVTGVAAEGPVRVGLARWIVGQALVLHSPADLQVVVLTTSSDEWGWLRWVPHALDATGAVRVAAEEESTARRLTELLALVERRLAARAENRSVDEGPVLVVIDGSRRLRLLPGVADLLRRGPGVGICFVCLDTEERLLPEECRVVVDVDAATVRTTGAATVADVRGEQVCAAWAQRVARALAPVRDVGDAGTDALPRTSRLLDVLATPLTAEAVRSGWEQRPRSTGAVLGQTEDKTFEIDLVRDGPHALVAGTTGAGKSELLQTLIASLALGNRPDELTFVLVDYKGGAAFADCRDLPHTVGMVTDLDGHLTARALDSLGAELRRREAVLARSGAKDVEAYLDARGPSDPPVPRLVIVIDEFAALATELPDFVTGLVDVARRGRSLGVHLVLATQRPAGVVSAEIRANTALRIALRVTDAADSQDIIDSSAAVDIAAATPGRALARLGTAAPVAFQTARVGGRAGPRALDRVRVAPMSAAGESLDSGGESSDGPSDLARLVAAVQEAATLVDVRPPQRPWLPSLPDVVVLDDLPPATEPLVPFGLADVPTEQRRESAVLDLAAGRHLGIVAGPRAGRSTALRSIAGAIGRSSSPEDVHLHAVDCGANALLPLVALPHVGVVVTRDQPDRMTRLVERLRRLVAERQQTLATDGFADVAEQRASAAPADRMPYVVVLLDRWEGLVAAYDSVDGGAVVTAWQQLMQEGGAVGVTVVVTGDRSLGVGRMAALLDDRLVLRTPEQGDYAVIGLPARQVPESMVPGRGFRAAGLRETQVALLDTDPSGTAQVAAVQRIGREATTRWADVPTTRRPFRLDVLPVRIGLEEALDLAGPATDELVLAVGGDTLERRGLDPLRHGPGLLVTGPRRSGRSTALRTMATTALRQGWEVAVVTPRTSPLRSLCAEPGVHGPFDEDSDPTAVAELLAKLRDTDVATMTLVDDVELVGVDGWLPALLERHLEGLRDSGSVLVAAGSPAELASVYRGPVVTLKRSGSGLLLSPQASTDADLYSARLPRSALGQLLPAGAGYLMTAGRAERVQVIWPG
ncbi:hypothetical protein GCM10011519_18460 [Marmoricola endophyticus]|uniref:FtsK domain-containing protein n=1 Tax=Marmoricola endophyticus TaxID=2040280 RepID=A0A917BL35_9ACTN|nr:FtsK/SpoIIIE domain-containing protein [Marmoricola endophyticus]GGF44928.1 hypothetical protein GCM10011519_18460 [Marmoricola endophyticus]